MSPISFCDTVLMGLARDGGLLLPEKIPDFSGRLHELKGLPYRDLALEVMMPYVDVGRDDLRALIARSYSSFDHAAITPVVGAGDVHIMELFHGPTLSFKDIALQFLGNLFEYILRKNGGELNILAATSGDTGSAAIYGVRGRQKMRIFVMHPHERISRIQELQMTSVPDDNVFNIAVKGTFDDCQAIMKQIFGDLDFKDRCSLGSVNSINWARLLAQVVYYFFGAFRVMEKTGAGEVAFAVPTGNFGDILAGYIAARMGAPIARLVLATNENDILARFFNTGVYGIGKVVPTLSPSMDIQVASNFERYLYYLGGGNADAVKRLMTQFANTGSFEMKEHAGKDRLFVAGTADTRRTLDTIRKYWESRGYLADPHTAVGINVAERFMQKGVPMICLATAHPAKFPAAIADATGKAIARHPAIDKLLGLPARCEVLPADAGAVREFIADRVGSR